MAHGQPLTFRIKMNSSTLGTGKIRFLELEYFGPLFIKSLHYMSPICSFLSPSFSHPRNILSLSCNMVFISETKLIIKIYSSFYLRKTVFKDIAVQKMVSFSSTSIPCIAWPVTFRWVSHFAVEFQHTHKSGHFFVWE